MQAHPHRLDPSSPVLKPISPPHPMSPPSWTVPPFARVVSSFSGWHPPPHPHHGLIMACGQRSRLLCGLTFKKAYLMELSL